MSAQGDAMAGYLEVLDDRAWRRARGMARDPLQEALIAGHEPWHGAVSGEVATFFSDCDQARADLLSRLRGEGVCHHFVRRDPGRKVLRLGGRWRGGDFYHCPGGLPPDEVPPNYANFRGEVPLHWAARLGEEGLSYIALLLERGADPNHTDMRGQTPLHDALMGSLESVLRLLEAGADPRVADQMGSSPLRRARLRSSGGSDRREMIRALEEAAARLDARDAALGPDPDYSHRDEGPMSGPAL